MKQIKKQAIDYLKKNYNSSFSNDIGNNSLGDDIIDAYVAGAEFVQKWIPVEKDLPEKDDYFSRLSVTVEARNTMKVQSAYYDFSLKQWRSTVTGHIIFPTHWRSIELK